MLPVAIIWTDEKPSEGLQFKEGKRGCVASMLVAASKGRTAFFDRKTFGCPGGGVGIGFGDYGNFPIHCLLSTGDQAWATQENRPGSFMLQGERFFKNPDIVRKWISSLPITDIPSKYIVFKPLDKVSDQDEVKVIHFLVNGDQLSALVVLSDYDRGSNQSVVAPYGGACQSILFAYAEADKDEPRGVIGFFDIAQRSSVPREILSFTVPYRMFKDMEANIIGSFLELETWHKLQERQ
jgi:uncharacterized protein (DUF169 family)